MMIVMVVTVKLNWCWILVGGGEREMPTFIEHLLARHPAKSFYAISLGNSSSLFKLGLGDLLSLLHFEHSGWNFQLSPLLFSPK